MTHFEKVVHLLSRVFDRIAGVALIAMTLLICANILLRLVWRPIYGTYDFVMFLCSVAISFAIAYCALKKGHIAVEIVVSRFPQRSQAIIGSIIDFLSAGFFALTAWQCGVYGTDMWHSGEVSTSVYIPFYPFIYGVGCGCGLLCLVLLVDLGKLLARIVKK